MWNSSLPLHTQTVWSERLLSVFIHNALLSLPEKNEKFRCLIHLHTETNSVSYRCML